MTLSRGWHGATGGLLRAAAAGCVTAGIVAGIWAGPAAFASSSVPRSASPAASAPAKYYIVPAPGQGGTQTLYDIALRTLGNGARYVEIFNLNKGRLQPNGERLESPRAIHAGWILRLPADARGPRVRFGPLPVSPAAATTAPASAPASHQPSVPAAAASHGGSLGFGAAVGGILLIVVLAGLAVLLGRRPWRRAGRQGLHGRAADTGQRSTPGAARRQVAGAGHPSSSGASHLGPLGPEHPSFPGAGHLGTVDPGEPVWPGPDPYGTFGPEHPSFPGAGHLGTVDPGEPVWPGPEPDRGSRAFSQTAGAPPERPPRARHQAGAGAGLGGGRAEAVLAPQTYPAPGPVPGPSGRHAARQLTERAQTGPSQALVPRNADSVRLAERMLAEADQQATRIITTAEQTAAEIGQSAAEQAAAALAVAEQEAARLRASLAEMTAELGRAAESVMAVPAASVTATAPGVRPASRPRRDSTARPAGKPGVSPRRMPKPKPAATSKSRQISAWHRMIAALVVLSVIGAASAATEIGLHGLSFFVFRNAGAGAGNARNFEENQGPGQADAPGTHHQARHGQPGGPAGPSK
jgi:hypothetical protein